MLKFLCCCAGKQSVEIEKVNEVAPPIQTITLEQKEKEIVLTKTTDFNSTSDSIITNGPLETVESSGTISDNDSTIATVNNSNEENKSLPDKKLKSSSKYLLGKSISYFYLQVNRYYFIKNKLDEKDVFFGKFVTIDKAKNICVTFQISHSLNKQVFNADDYIFYRATPKHK